MRRRHLSVIVVLLALANVALAAAPSATQPSGAELVRQARAFENWVHDVDSLLLRFEGTWMRPAEAIRRTEAQLRRVLGNDPLDPKQHSELRPEMLETLEIAFDRKRFRKHVRRVDESERLTVWNGTRLIDHEKYFSHAQEHYAIAKSPARIGGYLLLDLSWLRAQPHEFAWYEMGAAQWTAVPLHFGPATEFVVTGRQEYCGVDCYVLHRTGHNFRRWLIGVETGHIHGIMEGHLPGETPEMDRIAVALAEEAGGTVGSHKEFWEWVKQFDQPTQNGLRQALQFRLAALRHPRYQHRLLDYKEVGPGQWFPMTQGYTVFSGTIAAPRVDLRRDLRAVEVTVNQPLTAELFQVEMAEGVDVIDRTYDPALLYKHKKDRTAEEWRDIIASAEAQRRQQKVGAHAAATTQSSGP